MIKMIIAGWSFTHACNLRCVHCYNSSGRTDANELSHDDAVKVAEKLISEKVDAINFGGGECPLRKDFFELCEMLHKAGIKLSLTTNGTTYKLVAPYLHLFHDIGVSIDFADKEKHDWFRGVNGVYGKAIEAVKFFVANKVDCEIVTCITKLNANEAELKKMYELAKKLKVNYWRLNRYRPTGRAGFEEKLTLEPDDLKRAYTFLNSLLNDDSFVMPDPLFSILGRKVSQCPCAKTSMRILSNGEVSPCVYLKLSGGSILHKSLGEIMNSEIFKKARDRDLSKAKCANCEFFSQCSGGCAGSAYITYGTFDMPDPLCWHEPHSRKWNVHEKYLCTAYIPLNAGMGDQVA